MFVCVILDYGVGVSGEAALGKLNTAQSIIVNQQTQGYIMLAHSRFSGLPFQADLNITLIQTHTHTQYNTSTTQPDTLIQSGSGLMCKKGKSTNTLAMR